MVLFESDQVAVWREGETRDWKFSELRTQDQGETQQAFMDVPLRAPVFGGLPPEHFIPEAFQKLNPGENCGVIQLSAHLGLDRDTLEAELRESWSRHYPEEKDFFCTPRMLLEFGERRGINTYYVLGARLMASKVTPGASKSLAFTSHSGHVLIFKKRHLGF